MFRKNYRILQIDDDPSFHQQMRYMFSKSYVFEGVKNIEGFHRILKNKEEFDLVLLDLVLDDSGEFLGLTLIENIRQTWSGIPIIVITQDKQKSTVVKAMKAGANNFLDKADFDFELWDEVFLEAIEQKEEKEELKHQLQEEKRKNTYVEPEANPFIGSSALIQTLKKTLKVVAEAPDVTVMITGETGVGKGVAARFLHANSPKRKDKPFQEINISTITRDLVPSQLFGHKKGSFTGASEDMKGRLELANQGIVFLDEIGELDLENQVKILNFLQDKTITPIGAKNAIKLDLQIVAATNKNLIDEVKNGNFREDLFHRLQVFPIKIPPLRDRREDILPLLAHFMNCSKEQIFDEIEFEVIEFFRHHCLWTGNVRQLSNTVTSMFLQKSVLGVPKVNKDCLPEGLFDQNIRSSPISLSNSISVSVPSTNHLSSFSTLNEEIAFKKLKEIEDALNLKNGKKKDVAKMLGYEVDDNLRYNVVKYLKAYTHLAKGFPRICEVYQKQLQKLGI